MAKASRKSSLSIVYPAERLFECRDCAARCCRGWAIPVSPEEAHALLSDEELRARLTGKAPAILAGGTLPMREHSGQLQCVFLDEDELCSVQKKHGHGALPAACQAYPFGFMQDEQKRPVVQLSRYCPSIRDNYGKPLGTIVEAKLSQVGGAKPLAARMGLKSGRTLPSEQYLALVEHWRALLSGNPAEAVLRAYDFTDRFDERLNAKEPKLSEVRQSIDALAADSRELPTPPRGKLGFSARLFFAHLLSTLSYPVRVSLPAAVQRPSWGKRLAASWVQLKWLLGLGKVDLLHAGQVRLGQIAHVAPFLSGKQAEPINDYLRELLERRQPFGRQTYLSRVLVDLGLAVALISRYARARAAAEGLREVRKMDVAEGIGAAELCLSHQATEGESTVLSQLRLKLMSDPDAFRRFFGSEL